MVGWSPGWLAGGSRQRWQQPVANNQLQRTGDIDDHDGDVDDLDGDVDDSNDHNGDDTVEKNESRDDAK